MWMLLLKPMYWMAELHAWASEKWGNGACDLTAWLAERRMAAASYYDALYAEYCECYCDDEDEPEEDEEDEAPE